MGIANLFTVSCDEVMEHEGFRIRETGIGDRVGAELIGGSVYEVDPGKKLWPYHLHHANEEWMVVVRGRPTLRAPEGERELVDGDVVCFRRGPAGAHQVRNETEEPVRILMLSTRIAPEILEYPDSDKVVTVNARGEDIATTRHGEPVGYWAASRSWARGGTRRDRRLVRSVAMATREAACHCGQLRLEVTGDPFVVSMCHCLACKRRTGSAFGMQAAFTPDQVHVVGRFNDYLRVSDEADRKEHVFHFCPDCGSQVFYTEPEELDLIVVSVGSFADPSFPPPTESGYDSRRFPWLAVPDTIERHDGQ